MLIIFISPHRNSIGLNITITYFWDDGYLRDFCVKTGGIK